MTCLNQWTMTTSAKQNTWSVMLLYDDKVLAVWHILKLTWGWREEITERDTETSILVTAFAFRWRLRGRGRSWSIRWSVKSSNIQTIIHTKSHVYVITALVVTEFEIIAISWTTTATATTTAGRRRLGFWLEFAVLGLRYDSGRSNDKIYVR